MKEIENSEKSKSLEKGANWIILFILYTLFIAVENTYLNKSFFALNIIQNTQTHFCLLYIKLQLTDTFGTNISKSDMFR